MTGAPTRVERLQTLLGAPRGFPTMSRDAPDPAVDPTIYDRPVALLRELIRFDTTNPPGDERACVEYTAELLGAAGFETELYANDPARPNLVARLPGGGDEPALMLYGHVDVVPTAGQDWTHPPFAGVVEDGCVWGRGALDMKGGVAMMLAAGLRAAAEDLDLAGDLVVMILADEEAGGTDGASFVVEDHPEVFADVEYALGEFGGFNLELAGERFYPIQTNEKGICQLRATFRGPGGHGSTARSGGAVPDMARALVALDETRLPVHVTPTVESMVERMAAELEPPMDERLRAVLDPERTDAVLEDLGDAGERLDAVTHNTANPTIVEGGTKDNVIPTEVAVTLDCRVVPGQTREDLERELRGVMPDDVEVEFEPVQVENYPAETDLGLFDLLAGVLEDADPEGTAIPLLQAGATDGRHLARVGVQSYGFTPMRLPESFDFESVVHAADERIPVESLAFGVDAMYEAVRRYQDGDAA